MIQHIVLFRFPQSLTDDEFAEWSDLARGWSSEIDGVTAVRLGPPMSTVMTDGYQYLLYVDIKDPQALNGYLAHPSHGKFGAWAAGRGSEFLVYDYDLDDATVMLA